MGKMVTLIDGRVGQVIAAWDGFYERVHGEPVDFRRVQRSRIYVRIADEWIGCGQCRPVIRESFITLDADTVVSSQQMSTDCHR